MRRLLKWLIGLGGLVGAWLWSRGATSPREWPKRLPAELSALWDDLDEAFAAGRRAADDQEQRFDEQMRRPPGERH